MYQEKFRQKQGKFLVVSKLYSATLYVMHVLFKDL